MLLISVHPGKTFKLFGYDEGFARLKEAGIEGIQYGLGAEMMPRNSIMNGQETLLDHPLDEILEFLRPVKEASKKYGVAISHVHAPFPAQVPGRPDINDRLQPILLKSIALTEYLDLSLIHISEPTRRTPISFAVLCLKKFFF